MSQCEKPPALVPNTVVLLAWSAIDPSTLKLRTAFATDKLEELAESIARVGLLENLIVRPLAGDSDRYEVVAGERRWRAIGRLVDQDRWDADTPLVAAQVLDLEDGAARALALVENLQRENLNPMEEADAFAALQGLDAERWSTKSIAAEIGRTKRYVEQYLRLHELSPDDQMTLRQGKLTFTEARTKLTRSLASVNGTPSSPTARARLSTPSTAKSVSAPDPKPFKTDIYIGHATWSEIDGPMPVQVTLYDPTTRSYATYIREDHARTAQTEPPPQPPTVKCDRTDHRQDGRESAVAGPVDPVHPEDALDIPDNMQRRS